MPMHSKAAVLLLVLLPALTAQAGIWGTESWGRMYWGENQATAPQVPPTIESAVVSEESLTITVTPSVGGDGSDGWSAIYEYQVVCGNLDPVVFQNAVTIEGLEPGEIYSCSVVARNELGDSEAAIEVLETEPLKGLNLILLCGATDCTS